MGMQLLSYLPLRLPSTKVRGKTDCWILFTYLFSYAGFPAFV